MVRRKATDGIRPHGGARRVVGDQRAASTLEFAIVAAPFFALLIAIAQTGVVFFAQQALETAAQGAARQILVGNVQKAGMSKANFKTMACTKIPAFMDCANLLVDVRKVDSFATADMSAPVVTFSGGVPSSNGQFQPGAPGDIVLVRLSYPYATVTGPLGFDLSTLSQGQRLLIATSLARTEPY